MYASQQGLDFFHFSFFFLGTLSRHSSMNRSHAENPKKPSYTYTPSTLQTHIPSKESLHSFIHPFIPSFNHSSQLNSSKKRLSFLSLYTPNTNPIPPIPPIPPHQNALNLKSFIFHLESQPVNPPQRTPHSTLTDPHHEKNSQSNPI